MGSISKHTVVNVGTSDVQAITANLSRKSLVIQNKSGSNTLKVKFGSAVVGSDVTVVQTLTFTNTATAGSLVLRWNGNNSAGLVTTDAAADVQTKLQAVTGLGSVTVSGDWTAGFVITLTSVTPQSFATDPLLTIFSQSLNIAAVTEVQHLAFGTVPDAGSFKIHTGGQDTALILFSDNAATVQTKLRALTGYGSVTVAGDFTAGFDLTFTGISGPVPVVSTNTNTLVTLTVPVAITPSETTLGVVGATTTATIAVTTPGKYADGYAIAVSASLAFAGESCPVDTIHIVASGSSTRVEFIEGIG